MLRRAVLAPVRRLCTASTATRSQFLHFERRQTRFNDNDMFGHVNNVCTAAQCSTSHRSTRSSHGAPTRAGDLLRPHGRRGQQPFDRARRGPSAPAVRGGVRLPVPDSALLPAPCGRGTVHHQARKLERRLLDRVVCGRVAASGGAGEVRTLLY